MSQNKFFTQHWLEFFNGTDNQGTKAASQSGCKIDFGDVVHDMRLHLGNTTGTVLLFGHGQPLSDLGNIGYEPTAAVHFSPF